MRWLEIASVHVFYILARAWGRKRPCQVGIRKIMMSDYNFPSEIIV